MYFFNFEFKFGAQKELLKIFNYLNRFKSLDFQFINLKILVNFTKFIKFENSQKFSEIQDAKGLILKLILK